VEHALGWHADIAVYIATAYTIYYIWLCNVWEKILPRLNFNINLAAEEKAKFERLNNKKAMIGTWGEPNDEGVPNDQDLLWFRCAEGEELLFGESQRVMPGLIDTIMCGCGGNVYAVAVTSHRIIIQHDKRCLFGSTVLTTNEESYFVKNVHKANLNTDGCLNLGICTLHSSEMLSGGFNWIALGWIIDLILEWKPDLMNAITDERLKGWINMVPDDVIYVLLRPCALRDLPLPRPSLLPHVPAELAHGGDGQAGGGKELHAEVPVSCTPGIPHARRYHAGPLWEDLNSAHRNGIGVCAWKCDTLMEWLLNVREAKSGECGQTHFSLKRGMYREKQPSIRANDCVEQHDLHASSRSRWA